MPRLMAEDDSELFRVVATYDNGHVSHLGPYRSLRSAKSAATRHWAVSNQRKALGYTWIPYLVTTRIQRCEIEWKEHG